MSSPPPPPLPRYGEASLSDLMPSLLAALDVPGFANPLGVEPLRRACLLVADGLGWEVLLATRPAAPGPPCWWPTASAGSCCWPPARPPPPWPARPNGAGR